MFQDLTVAGALIAATTFLHAVAIAVGAAVFRWMRARPRGARKVVGDAVVLIAVSFVLLGAHFAEIWVWAGAMLWIDAFEDLDTALYFAAVSYTTLGFGDILLPDEWRHLAGAAALNGLLLVGLSAAFMVEASVKLRLAGDPG